MLRQRAGIVGVAELVEQPRRALDIGEEEGDGAGRKITPPHARREDTPGELRAAVATASEG